MEVRSRLALGVAEVGSPFEPFVALWLRAVWNTNRRVRAAVRDDNYMTSAMARVWMRANEYIAMTNT